MLLSWLGPLTTSKSARDGALNLDISVLPLKTKRSVAYSSVVMREGFKVAVNVDCACAENAAKKKAGKTNKLIKNERIVISTGTTAKLKEGNGRGKFIML